MIGFYFVRANRLPLGPIYPVWLGGAFCGIVGLAVLWSQEPPKQSTFDHNKDDQSPMAEPQANQSNFFTFADIIDTKEYKVHLAPYIVYIKSLSIRYTSIEFVVTHQGHQLLSQSLVTIQNYKPDVFSIVNYSYMCFNNTLFNYIYFMEQYHDIYYAKLIQDLTNDLAKCQTEYALYKESINTYTALHNKDGEMSHSACRLSLAEERYALGVSRKLHSACQSIVEHHQIYPEYYFTMGYKAAKHITCATTQIHQSNGIIQDKIESAYNSVIADLKYQLMICNYGSDVDQKITALGQCNERLELCYDQLKEHYDSRINIDDNIDHAEIACLIGRNALQDEIATYKKDLEAKDAIISQLTNILENIKNTDAVQCQSVPLTEAKPQEEVNHVTPTPPLVEKQQTIEKHEALTPLEQMEQALLELFMV